MENLGPLCAVALLAIVIGYIIWWQAKRPNPEPYTIVIRDKDGVITRRVKIECTPCARVTTVPTFKDYHKAQ